MVRELLHTSEYLTIMTSFGNNRIHMIFVATPLAIHLSHTPKYYTGTCVFRRHTMFVAKVSVRGTDD